MDYGQFLMACVDEWIHDAEAQHHELDFEDISAHISYLDSIIISHDEMMDDIFCYFYVDHGVDLCPAWRHC